MKIKPLIHVVLLSLMLLALWQSAVFFSTFHATCCHHRMMCLRNYTIAMIYCGNTAKLPYLKLV